MKLITDRIGRVFKSKNFKRFAPLVVIIIILLVSLVTCTRRQEPAQPSPEPPVVSISPPSPTPSMTELAAEPAPIPESAPAPEPVYSGPVNPLTGLPSVNDMANRRPLAIMINDHRVAQPQLGVSQADIIYETLVEGGITRMLALFMDVSNVGEIGSIRSSRLYYVDIAQSYDAVFIFAGGSPQAYTALSDRNITRLDGVNGKLTDIFYRDKQRLLTMSSEHTMVTTGALITKYLPTYNFRLEHNSGYKTVLSFKEDGTPADGKPALDFAVKFSSSKNTTFSYIADDKLYYLGQFGSSYRDGNNNAQLAFTNVLILKTSVSGIAGDTAGRLNIRTTGNGSGYFVCGGKYIEINWSRADNSSQFKYTLKDGSDLVLGRGKTYICIIPSDVDVNIA